MTDLIPSIQLDTYKLPSIRLDTRSTNELKLSNSSWTWIYSMIFFSRIETHNILFNHSQTAHKYTQT